MIKKLITILQKLPKFGATIEIYRREDKIVSNRKIKCYGESIFYSLHTPPIKRWEFTVTKHFFTMVTLVILV